MMQQVAEARWDDADAQLTFFFIVEPPSYSVLACYLAASLRQQFGNSVKLVGYCPISKWDKISEQSREVLRRLGCDLRSFETEGRFTPAYPHGNKILATLEPRETPYSCFLDSDILCLRPNKVENLIKPGHVSLSRAASMFWAKQTIWDEIYGVMGMKIPEERFLLMRRTDGKPVVPYFSSGLFCFPEKDLGPEGMTFAQTWMDTAQRIDSLANVAKKRPYLDQMSLPLAIQRAGLTWNILPDEQHYILGGRLRGQPLPKDTEIFTVHYRRWEVLKETRLVGAAKKMLSDHAGVRRLGQIGGGRDKFDAEIALSAP